MLFHARPCLHEISSDEGESVEALDQKHFNRISEPHAYRRSEVDETNAYQQCHCCLKRMHDKAALSAFRIVRTVLMEAITAYDVQTAATYFRVLIEVRYCPLSEYAV